MIGIRKRGWTRARKMIGLQLLVVTPLFTGCAPDSSTDSAIGPSNVVSALVTSSVACGMNQPAGFHSLNVVPLSVKSAPGTGPVPLGPWSGSMAVATDPSRGLVAQLSYNVGFAGGRSPGQAWMDGTTLKTQNVKDVYFCAWLQPSTKFVGHSSGINKVVFFGLGKNGNQAVLALYGIGAGSLRFRLLGQGTTGIPPGATNTATCGPFGCSWGWTSGPVVPRGSWSMVEVVIHSGPAGGLTSWMEGYLNGVSNGRIGGFNFLWPASNGTNPRAEKIAISPTWGGTGGTVVSAFNLQLSDMVVTGK